MSGLIRFSEMAVYNNAPHAARNYRMPVQVPAPFKPGDVAPCVAYIVPLAGGERRPSFQTTARVGDGFLVLDHFDPLLDVSLGADRQPAHETVAYLIDAEGAEHEAFTVQMQREVSGVELPVRPKWAGVGLHTLVVYSHTADSRSIEDLKTRERVGTCDAFVKSDGKVDIRGFSTGTEKPRLSLWFKNPITGAESFFVRAEGIIR